MKQRKDCGCSSIESLKGREFGHLTVIGNQIYKNKRIYYECRCDCNSGKVTTVRSDSLLSGKITSCGCSKIKHGMSLVNLRLLKEYHAMKRRCFNKDDKRYYCYGGRGINICDEWLGNNGIKNFCEWALCNGYNDVLTIERNDVNGNYCPENCSWIPMPEQAKNKRNTIFLDIDGIDDQIKLVDLSEQTGKCRETLLRRYNNGINDMETITDDNRTNNTSGIIGVSYSETQNNWRSYINYNNKRYELGRSKDKNIAISKRLKAEKKYFGESAPQKHLFEQYNI